MVTLLLSSVSPLSAEAAGQRPAASAQNDKDVASDVGIIGLGAFVASLLAGDCDQLASPPGDPDRNGSGVEREKIDITKALPACERAAQQSPVRPRYQYL